MTKYLFFLAMLSKTMSLEDKIYVVILAWETWGTIFMSLAVVWWLT
jgi:hypothetical protein